MINLTIITGRLNLKVDSLENETDRQQIDLSSIVALPEVKFSAPEKTLFFARTFGDGLFKVDSQVKFSPTWVENDLQLTQLRDIRFDVVNTTNSDRSRMLTYVSSPNFEDLEYQSYTELRPEKRFPWFWIGLGAGVAGAVIFLN